MPDNVILTYATLSQIVDELKKRYVSGLIVASKSNGMECGEWGPDHSKLGLMQIATDTIVYRNRGKCEKGLDEDR